MCARLLVNRSASILVHTRDCVLHYDQFKISSNLHECLPQQIVTEQMNGMVLILTFKCVL